MVFLSGHCSGKGPHLVLRKESHGFSPVAAGSLGFLSRGCDGDLRDLLTLPPRIQVSFQGSEDIRIALSCCQRKRAMSRVQSVQLSVPVQRDRDLRFPLKVQLGVRPHLVSRHGTRLSSRVVKGFSGLPVEFRQEIEAFQEDQCQASHHVVRICDALGRCTGIQDLSRVERQLSVLSSLQQEPRGSNRVQYMRQATPGGAGKLGFLLS